jgi:hypothetical protein
MDPEAIVGEPSGGILGRFENVRERKSAKKIIQCAAATPAFSQHDYLKPTHLPVDRVDHEANYCPTSNINETKFHKGFSRRNKADIQQDAARLEAEVMRDLVREDRARASVAATMEAKEKVTFNILTGDGVGRESEFRQVGKKIVNPYGCMEATYGEHAKDASNRIKNSKHRFFEHPMANSYEKRDRQENIFKEGLHHTKRESAILGYGSAGVRRVRSQSCGTSDNFAHLRALPAEPSYEAQHYGNYSQIILG